MLALSALEYGFISLLVFMSALAGLISAVVVVRVVEPRGLRVLLDRLRPRLFKERETGPVSPPPTPSWRRR